MKYLLATLALLAAVLMTGCDVELCPEGQHYGTTYGYHFGYNPVTQKSEYFFGHYQTCLPN